MTQPLVIAYHLIWTAYATWLPNDPRGSGSRTINSDVLAELGELHHGRKRVQPPGRVVREFYSRAKPFLKHTVRCFQEPARLEIARSFTEVIQRETYSCYACAIMPDHVHILIRKHKHQAEDMLHHLKEASRLRLSITKHLPPDHPCWTGGDGWKVFLDHPDEVRRTIDYLRKNPRKIGLPDQHWPFVKDYDGWPLHPGHSPNSPYARGLRAVGRYSHG